MFIFSLGILLAVAGAMMVMMTSLKARQGIRNLSPQRVSHRSAAIEIMMREKRKGLTDGTIIMVAGFILILITSVLN